MPVSTRSSEKPFSKRHNYDSEPKPVSVWEDAPESLRSFVLNQAEELKFGPHLLRDAICSVLHKRPNPNNWSAYPNVMGEAENLIHDCEWFKFYDFIERVYKSMQRSCPMNEARKFQNALNDFLIDEGIGWKMIDGEIVARGTETFEANVQIAVDLLGAMGRITARDEIHEALKDLSRRPEADLTGAIQHAMAALECVARVVCGDERATLGEIIRKYPGTIPKPLDEAVAKAWGFASERGRHIREGNGPERREVELVVGLAATVATYLTR